MASFAFALSGGETQTIYSEGCEKAFVNVTGIDEIDEGEFYLSDNCIMDYPYVYNCTCNKNITFTTKVNAENNYTIIVDYELIVESQNDVSDIEILNKDIVVKNISYIDNEIKMVLSGEGNKTINIGVPKCPSKLYIDDVEETFTCISNIVSFDLSFSIRYISLLFSTPTITSSGGGGSSHSYDSQDKIIKQNKTDWKDDYNDSLGEPIIIEDKEIEESQGYDIVDTPKTEENNKLTWIIVSIVIVGIGALIYYILRGGKAEGEE